MKPEEFVVGKTIQSITTQGSLRESKGYRIDILCTDGSALRIRAINSFFIPEPLMTYIPPVLGGAIEAANDA